MEMFTLCNTCIHKSVCAYKEHYEDAVDAYAKARQECGKYPWFKCKIECVQYLKEDVVFRGITADLREATTQKEGENGNND